MLTELQQSMLTYMDAAHAGDGVFETSVNGLTLLRMSQKTLPQHMIYKPELCVVVQGAKSIMLGDAVIDYCAMEALVVSMSLPGVGKVIEASVAQPLLVIRLELDLALLHDVLREIKQPPRLATEKGLGVYVHSVGAPLADCLLRLLRMLASPSDIPMLLPLLLRELYYRLLTGPNGDKLGWLGLPDSRTRRLTEALHLLRDDFARPVLIEELAAMAGMSASSFHYHFKELTSMTPLRYQKQLRLLEAKRLMLMEDANVTHAAFHVGYESPSQFSREYARMFGSPPKRDVAAMRELYQVYKTAAISGLD
jgi:AraC-like DNA-binding protein